MPDPAAMLGGLGQFFGVALLMLLGLLVLYTAALRAAIRPVDRAFAYLRIGMDEPRVLAVALILGIAFLILYIALVFVASLVGIAIATMAHDASVPLVIVLTLAVSAVLIFVEVRFSLVFALTLLRGKIIIGESWSLTRGRFWTPFGAYFVLVLIVFAAATVLFGIDAGSYLAELGRSVGNPAAIQAAQQQQLARQFSPLTPMSLLSAIPGAIFGAFWITLGAGAASAAMTGLRDDAFADIGMVYE